MKKILIPTILAAIIIIAASFALMPVQRATTTHLPSVTGANIAADSIGSAQIGTGAVGADELAANAVTAAGGELADGVLTADPAGRLKMVDGFVDSAEILNASVANADLAAAAIQNSFANTAGLASISTSITVTRASTAIVIVTFSGLATAAGAITDTLTLTPVTNTAGGTITAPTAIVGTVQTTNTAQSFMFQVTGLVAGTASYTSTVTGGAGLTAANHIVEVILLPA